MRRIPSALAALAIAAFLAGQAQAASEVYKWTDANGVVHYTDFPPSGNVYEKLNMGGAGARTATALPEPEAPVEAPKPVVTTTQSNCQVARKNVETFANSASIRMDRDGDGEAEELDDVQRAAELSRNQELAKLYCGE